ncbi:MAG TPA: efflux RND transporter permease subunit, partial [Leptospiraceae bacterium]|nr:efflux RND transporter permease subunit [Leptospiraceae bacterium]
LGGQFENLKRSQERLTYIVPLTLLLIYLTLLVFFKNNYIHAAIVTANIPFAVIGGVIGLYIRGMHFSISAGVGFVSLFGISVMSGVLLLSFLNHMKHNTDLPLKEMVIQGSVIQFRPRFLVMMIAIIGLMPAALNTGIGSDVQRPLATVIVGGLFSSLVLTMLVSPLIYYILEKRFQKNSRR